MTDQRLELCEQILAATAEIWSDDDEWQEYDHTGAPWEEIPEEFRPQFNNEPVEPVENGESIPTDEPTTGDS